MKSNLRRKGGCKGDSIATNSMSKFLTGVYGVSVQGALIGLALMAGVLIFPDSSRGSRTAREEPRQATTQTTTGQGQQPRDECALAIERYNNAVGEARATCARAGLSEDNCLELARECTSGNSAGQRADSSPLESLSMTLLASLGAGGAPLSQGFSRSQCLSASEYRERKRDLESRIRDLERDIRKSREDVVKEQERAAKEQGDLQRDMERAQEDLRKKMDDLTREEQEERVQNLSAMNDFAKQMRDDQQAMLQAQGQLTQIMLQRNALMSDIARAQERDRCLEEVRKVLQGQGVRTHGSANSTIRDRQAKAEQVRRTAALCTANARQARDAQLSQVNSQIEQLQSDIRNRQASLAETERSMQEAARIFQEKVANRATKRTQEEQAFLQTMTRLQQQMQLAMTNARSRLQNLEQQIGEQNAERVRLSTELAMLGGPPPGERSPREALAEVSRLSGLYNTTQSNCPPGDRRSGVLRPDAAIREGTR